MPKRRYKPRKKQKIQKSRKRAVLFISLAVFTLLLIMFVNLVDSRLLPAVISIEEYRINARINEAINTSLAELIEGDFNRLVSEDFYTIVVGSDGRVTSLHANTILINEIGMQLSQSLLEKLSTPMSERITVPIGTLLGVNWLANIGPSHVVRVMPIGLANVEHHTSFSSAGINQVNFQVWLTVYATMQIVNPMQTRTIYVQRSVPLVNTVFAGEVPDAMMWPLRH
ncbi:MAG: sporulation protein YunB [Defluviitaleaceae bacterium]|nr:sporulation protein YunB [Defluviitaleaceae bacterium]